MAGTGHHCAIVRDAETGTDAGRVIDIFRFSGADADLLSPNERAQIDSLMAGLADARENGDAPEVEAATKLLAQGTEAFAAERMNRGIQQALAGKNIETI